MTSYNIKYISPSNPSCIEQLQRQMRTFFEKYEIKTKQNKDISLEITMKGNFIAPHIQPLSEKDEIYVISSKSKEIINPNAKEIHIELDNTRYIIMQKRDK